MKYLSSVCCILIVLLLTACQGSSEPAATPTPPPQWETFHSAEGGFSVLFPTPPEKDLRSSDTSYGGIYTSTYQGMTYNAIFMIMAANQPPSDQLLQSLLDSQATDLKARVLSNEPIEFNGYAGLAYSLDAPKSKTLPEGGVVQGRIYHVNDRVYILYHTGAKKNSLMPDIKKFLGSLKVDGMVEQPTPAAAEDALKDWQDYVSQKDGFSVRLPGKPKREVLNSDKTMDTINTSVQDGNTVYSILTFNLKGSAVTKADPQTLLEMVKKSILTNQQATVVSETPIQLGKYNGYDIVINEPKSKDQPADGQIHMHLFVAGKRLYAPMALTLGTPPAEVVPFLDSFKIIAP